MAYFNPKYFNVYYTNYYFNKSIIIPANAYIRISLNINKRQDHSLDINKNTDFSVFR
jgi:hypothetical protein